MKKSYTRIISHYENCLEKYGDNHLGVDWPKIEDVDKRYQVMMELIKFDLHNLISPTLLDFGCGTAHLLEFIQKRNIDIKYSGLDISEKFINISKEKFPLIDFYCVDFLDNIITIPKFDYSVMNGVFTEKRELTFDQMWIYFSELIIKIFKNSNRGIAFNLMSKNVDWERDELFHVPFDLLSEFITNNLSRNYIIRNDYKLYEYSVYVYK